MSEVISVPASELKPFPNNPRTHSDEQIAQLVGSIQEFGFTAPVLITPEKVILAGHGRVEAAQAAGIDDIPCLVLEGLTDDQQRAYVIADNKLTLNGEWNIEALEQEIRKLAEADFDMDLIGFDEYELKRLMDAATDGNEDSEKDKKDGFNIQYQIVFDDEGQQERWYTFMRKVRAEFVGETFADSLDLWIGHNATDEE